MCSSCDADSRLKIAHEVVRDALGLQALPCHVCGIGHGLAANASCLPCDVSGCSKCPSFNMCEECLHGHVLSQVKPRNHTDEKAECQPCAQHCARCDHLGPGHCDPERCEAGYSLSPTGKCAPCSAHCLNCTQSGPGKCDAGQCKKNYGLQDSSKCSKCVVDHCDTCDASQDACDACSQGFGLTPEKTCEACADSCKRCADVGDCAECALGFGLQEGKCFACADQCEQCKVAGPGLCDAGHCYQGWIGKEVSARGFICIRNESAEVHA